MATKPKLESVGDVLDAMDAYEAWRPALIAFYRAESPWMTITLAGLQRGDPLSVDNRHVIDGLQAAFKVAP